MKVVSFAGYSGAGKTTLVERLIPVLKLQGQRVSVVKHAHHKFDIDHAGKDTFRHREAGAYEVVVASDRRLALIREFEQQPTVLSAHALLAELDAGVDWVLVEGFKQSDLPKIEIWREPQECEQPRPLRFPNDPCIIGIATDAPDRLPPDVTLPVFDVNDVDALGAWLLAHSARFEYKVNEVKSHVQ